MEITTILLLLWITPMFLNFILLYFDEDVKTWGDLFYQGYLHFIPLINLSFTGMFILDIVFGNLIGFIAGKITKFWNEIKDKKIK